MSDVKKLKEYAGMINIADEAKLDKEELMKIGDKVLKGFNDDLDSSSEWLSDVKKVEDLASLVCKKKNTPLPNSANIKYPLITKACYEFSSRTYPEIIRDGSVVKARVLGKDFTGEKELQAARVSDYMNYQLLFENNEWELELDRLLNQLALVGFICRKTYYDPIRKIVKSEICEYKDLIINSEVKSIDDARRISHVIHLRLNDLIEASRAGVFCEEPVNKLLEEHAADELDPEIDVIEQHCYLDLDDDKYAEPYIVTVVKQSGEVLRIAPRFNEEGITEKKGKVQCIDAIQFFTDYHFLVSPKGKFQSVGFGILMLHLNETINSVLNQLIDAGQLANMQGGYMDSRLKELGSGDTNHDPGEWKKIKAMAGVTLKDGILPIQYKEPSSVLQQLLGLLIEASKDLSSTSEVMTGSSSADNAKTGAVMALQQQGLKIFTSIHRRIYRSLTAEYRKIYKLNSIYLDPEKYFLVLDDKKAIFQKDFDGETIDIIPVADPNLSSELQRSAKNQVLLGVAQLPGIDPVKITERILRGSNIENPEEIMLPPEAMNQPNPQVIQIQAEIEKAAQDVNVKHRELDIREKEAQAQLYKIQCECLKLKADAILSIAKAESLEAGQQSQLYMKQLDMLSQSIENQMRMTEMDHEKNMMGQEQIHEQSMQQREAENAQQSQAMAGPSVN
jgi:chaperonin GroES